MKYIVYKASFENGKSYIGITSKTLRTRKRKHISASNNGSDFQFHRAIRKYGNPKWSILCSSVSRDSVEILEKSYIEKYDTFKNGYNMTLGGFEGHSKNVRENFIASGIESRFPKGMIPWNKGIPKKEWMSEEGFKNWTKANQNKKPLKQSTKLKIAKSQGAKRFGVYKNGSLIGTWVNQSECARELNLHAQNIGHCLKNRRKTHNNFEFKYVKEIGE